MHADDEKTKVNKTKTFDSHQKTGNKFRSNVDHRDQTKRDSTKITEKSSDNRRNNFCFNCGDPSHIAKHCIHKEKGTKCFRCSQFGHRGFECKSIKDKKTSDNIAEVHMVSSNNLILKDVTLISEHLIALVDTGSQRTLLRKSIFTKIKNSVKLQDTNISFVGLGQKSVKPLGYFQVDILIDGSTFSTDVYVIDDSSVNFDLVIGTDIIYQGTLTVSSTGTTLTKIVPESENFLINLINIVDDSETDLGHITDPHLRSQLLTLIQNYTPCKTKTLDIQMKILLTDEVPICSSPRRLSQPEKKIVENQIQEWLDKGIIRRSSSDFSSPIVLVKKKDNSYRLCVDYRRLNKKTVREHFPLPVIDDVIDQLHSAHVFTTLDLKNAFLHVDVEETSRKYTSFVTHDGQYEFLKCSYGLTNSPSVFQKYIYNAFRQLIKDGVVVIYMDDFIIPSQNEAEGITKLNLVLQTAADYGLEFNFKKCHFLKREIEFLGYKISNGNLYPSPNKTKAVLCFPEPKCTKDVQSFLGLTGYFRKFVKNYSIIAKPLSDLLKKDVTFQFGPAEKSSFAELQHILASEPVLTIYNPHAETEIHCDASIDGYGAVLIQKSIVDNQFHPVYFMSKKTTPAQRRYSSYELEVMAIVEALKKFRIYIFGIPFKIVTDCNAFKMTMDKKDICAKIARWAFLLSDFDYTIEHRKGTSMRHVDALSRNPICMITQDSFTLKIIDAQKTDDRIETIKEILQTKPYDDYFLKNNILYKLCNGVDLLVVPDDMQLNVIKHIHDQGHFARKRCEIAIKEQFFIPNLSAKIDKIITNCVTCILYNRKRGKQEGELHPLPKDETPLLTYHIDHLGPLQSTSKNYNHILCVIDAFTKFVWLYPCKTTTASEVIAKLRLQSYTFGNPQSIISDKGSAFTSHEFKQYCEDEGIKHMTVTTALPRANGQVERLNSIVISVISKLSQDTPDKWFRHVPRVQQIINSTYQRSVKRSPFELLIGTKMRQKEDLQLINLLNSVLEEQFIENREHLRTEAKENILKVQQENRRQYNLRRKKPHRYKIGDLVAIKRTQQGPGLKFRSKFLGPYKVVKLKPNDTYEVEKASITDGPMTTSTCAEYMKPWPNKL